MERSLLRRMLGPGADDILYDLTVRQHLKPHRSVGDTMSDAASGLGFCVSAAELALEWLQIDPATSIGRLRRGQLSQLSRSIYQYRRRADMAAAPCARTDLSFVTHVVDDSAQELGLA